MFGYQRYIWVIKFRQYYRPNNQLLQKAIESLNNNELTIEEILDDDELVNDLKQTNFSQITSQ